jgi:hypothetical protein
LFSSIQKLTRNRSLAGAVSSAVRSLPLIVIDCLVVGMRLVFEIPAALRSNWMFRTQLDANLGESIFLGPALRWTLIPAFRVFACVRLSRGIVDAVIYLLFLALLATLLVERPFTCSRPASEKMRSPCSRVRCSRRPCPRHSSCLRSGWLVAGHLSVSLESPGQG